MSEIQKGNSSDSFIKIETVQVEASDGATIEFDLDNIIEPTTVSARVEVAPTDVDSCETINPVTSFVLEDYDGRRTFIPSQALDPIQLRPRSTDDPIIK